MIFVSVIKFWILLVWELFQFINNCQLLHLLKVSTYVIEHYAGLLILATALVTGGIWYIQISPDTKAVANINKPSRVESNV